MLSTKRFLGRSSSRAAEQRLVVSALRGPIVPEFSSEDHRTDGSLLLRRSNDERRSCRRSCSSRAIASSHLCVSLMKTLGLQRRALLMAPLAVKARHAGPSAGCVK
jgi:hypothetical protein